MNNELLMPGSPFGIAWGFLYGVPDGDSPVFMPELRKLGATSTKLYLFWSQIEPEEGLYDWRAMDSFLEQLHTPDEALIALFSSSMWATRRQAQVLPPSPAKDLDSYARFVRALVGHCKGRVRYWQNDSEPNNPIFWDGTPEEFTAQLKVFYHSVKEADPQAVVVCGGYDGLFNPPGTYEMPDQKRGLAFFDHVLRESHADFDLFDLRLYADPYLIPYRVYAIRQKMIDLGISKPIICTEYHGPGLFEYPVNYQYAGLAGSWSSGITDDQEENRSASLAQTSVGVKALYDKIGTLAPQTQMFMQDCSPEFELTLRHLQCNEIVMRNVLALSAGIQKTMYWDFWHDTSQRYDLMMLMFGKHRLMDRQDNHFIPREPVAGTFKQMTEMFAGIKRVTQLPTMGQPTLFLFEVFRHGREPVYVAWDKRHPFTPDADRPPVTVTLPWTTPAAKAIDVLGRPLAARVDNGFAFVCVSSTPVYIERLSEVQHQTMPIN